MPAYYNEIDPYAAQWLRNLIAAGHIAPGDVDERSIVDVRPDDLRGYEQCHFFAGIGGWSLALRHAGWDDDRPVWTGSCPCPPFSSAGKEFRCPVCDTPSPVPNAVRAGAFDCIYCGHEWQLDERHLWPEFFRLILQRRPDRIYGEQVASKDGRTWLDVVLASLEMAGYAAGSPNLPACGVGAPHIRQRLWFVADAQRRTAERRRHDLAIASAGTPSEARKQRFRDDVWPGGDAGGAESEQVGVSGRARQPGSASGDLGDTASIGRSWLGDQPAHALARQAGPWASAELIPCTDGKRRPVEPGTFPLAHGIPGRVGRLRAYGNAIVPQVAAEFIAACIDTQSEMIP